MMRKIDLLCAGAALLALAASASAAPGYHLVKSVTLGGDTFWDGIAFDPANKHLFLTHGTHVVVVDSRTYQVAGDIAGLQGVHDVAVDAALGKGFISSGNENVVVEFDAKTLQVTKRIPVGTKPDAMVFDSFSHRVFSFNAGTKNATAIDVASGTVDGTIPLGGKPEFAVSDGKGRVYDNIEDTSEIVAIDSKTMEVVKRWPLAPCTEPSGIAFDKAHGRVFAACDNEMMAALDVKTGKVVTVPACKRPDGAGFDATSRDVLIPCGEGKLFVIHQETPDKYRLVANITTQFGARTMDYDQKGHRLFTVTADLTPDPGQHPPYKMAPGSFRLLVYGR
jgi:DNA-binding beta-propeller fold protein YncE